MVHSEIMLSDILFCRYIVLKMFSILFMRIYLRLFKKTWLNPCQAFGETPPLCQWHLVRRQQLMQKVVIKLSPGQGREQKEGSVQKQEKVKYPVVKWVTMVTPEKHMDWGPCHDKEFTYTAVMWFSMFWIGKNIYNKKRFSFFVFLNAKHLER